MEGARLHYIDVAKGILILLLLVSHFGILTNHAGMDNSRFVIMFYFQPLFTTFFMQCFFFITGYCTNFATALKPYLFKQLKQLVIPWLFFELLNEFFFRQGLFWDEFLENGVYTTFWFLNALLFAKIVCWFLSRCIKSQWLSILITILMLIGGIALCQFDVGRNILCIRQSLASCFFVQLGQFMRYHDQIYRMFIKYAWGGYLFLFIIAYIGNFAFAIPIIDGGFDSKLSQTPILLLVPILGIFAFLRLCHIIESNKFLEYFGKNSIVIYCIHIVPYICIIKFLKSYYIPNDLFTAMLFFIIAYLAEIVTMAIIIKCFNYVPLKYVIGKW